MTPRYYEPLSGLPGLAVTVRAAFWLTLGTAGLPRLRAIQTTPGTKVGFAHVAWQ